MPRRARPPPQAPRSSSPSRREMLPSRPVRRFWPGLPSRLVRPGLAMFGPDGAPPLTAKLEEHGLAWALRPNPNGAARPRPVRVATAPVRPGGKGSAGGLWVPSRTHPPHEFRSRLALDATPCPPRSLDRSAADSESANCLPQHRGPTLAESIGQLFLTRSSSRPSPSLSLSLSLSLSHHSAARLATERHLVFLPRPCNCTQSSFPPAEASLIRERSLS